MLCAVMSMDFVRKMLGMDKQEFVDELPSFTTCTECRLTIDAPIWRVSAFDSTDWLGLNVVSCPACANLICGAAGSSAPAVAEARRIRDKLLKQELENRAEKKR